MGEDHPILQPLLEAPTHRQGIVIQAAGVPREAGTGLSTPSSWWPCVSSAGRRLAKLLASAGEPGGPSCWGVGEERIPARRPHDLEHLSTVKLEQLKGTRQLVQRGGEAVPWGAGEEGGTGPRTLKGSLKGVPTGQLRAEVGPRLGQALWDTECACPGPSR